MSEMLEMKKMLIQKLEEIDSKPISYLQKEIEEEKLMLREWKMTSEEFGKDETLLQIYPSYACIPHLHRFLSEAHPRMIAFLQKHLKNGPIKCTFKLNLVFINRETNQLSFRSKTSWMKYNDISDLSGLIDDLHDRYEDDTSHDGLFEFKEVNHFDIMIG